MTLKMKALVAMRGGHPLEERKEKKNQKKRIVMRVKKRVIVIAVTMMKGVGTVKRKAKIADQLIGLAR